MKAAGKGKEAKSGQKINEFFFFFLLFISESGDKFAWAPSPHTTPCLEMYFM